MAHGSISDVWKTEHQPESRWDDCRVNGIGKALTLICVSWDFGDPRVLSVWCTIARCSGSEEIGSEYRFLSELCKMVGLGCRFWKLQLEIFRAFHMHPDQRDTHERERDAKWMVRLIGYLAKRKGTFFENDATPRL